MKEMKNRIANKIKALIPVLLSAICLVGCQENETESKDTVLRIGTNAEYAPYTFVKDHQIVGFDIDVATEVAKRLNKTPKISDLPFDALVSSLKTHQIDLIAAGMTPTKEREQEVSFVPAHYRGDSLVIVTQNIHISGLEDLKDKTIIVNEGYTADLFLSQNPAFKLIRLPNPNEAFLGLEAKRGDVFVTARSTYEDYLKVKSDPQFQAVALAGTEQACALGVAKDNPLLLEQIADVLMAMETDGTLHRLKEKWSL